MQRKNKYAMPVMFYQNTTGIKLEKIPILSDNYVSGENCKFSVLTKDNMTVRTLDFHKIEDEYALNFNATKIEIPKELYDELTNALRKSDLLLKDVLKE